jgi:hypothetical protein
MRIAKVLLMSFVFLCLIVGTNLSAALVSQAITFADCDTCQGSVYHLTVTPLNDNWYSVVLQIDTVWYDGDGDYIGDVSFKVSPDINQLILRSAPGSLTDWETQNGGLNADGCNGAGAGFGCSNSLVIPPPSAVNGTLTWEWWVETSSISDEWSIKARYVDVVDGELVKRGALVSESAEGEPSSEVPDAPTFALVGAGLTALAWRKFRHAPV